MHYNPRVTMMKATMKVEPPFRPLRGGGVVERPPLTKGGLSGLEVETPMRTPLPETCVAIGLQTLKVVLLVLLLLERKKGIIVVKEVIYA